MIGKILGAVAGSSISKHIDGVGGTRGALLGVGAAALLRRLGPVGLVTAIAGGYALKKYRQKREAPRFTGA